jgi:hypothetical protein
MSSTASLRLPAAPAAEPTIYYLLWRSRPSHPWHSEEFCNRIEAHKRYFALLERGLEAYLERRSRGELSA